MIVEFHKGDMSQDELCELSSISSMIDITPQDNKNNSNNQAS